MFNDNNHIPRATYPKIHVLTTVTICQKSESILHGQKDMDTGDFDLLTLLFSVNVSPMQISQITEQVKGPEAGTYHPKHVYDINQRTEDFKNFAIGLLPKSNDAVKQLLN